MPDSTAGLCEITEIYFLPVCQFLREMAEDVKKEEKKNG